MANLDDAALRIRRAIKALRDAQDTLDGLVRLAGPETRPKIQDALDEVEQAERQLKIALREVE